MAYAVPVFLCVGAGAAALAAALSWLTGGLTLPLGPWRLGLHDAFRPIVIALTCSGLAGLAMPSPEQRARWRRSALALIAGAAALALAILIRGLPAAFPVGDGAVAEIYVLHASRGPWAVGPYSQYFWHHPGPALFYALAPLHAAALQHSTALALGASLINVASLAGTAWLAARRLPVVVAAGLAAGVAAWLLRTSPLVASYWNAHLIVLPLLFYVWLSVEAAVGGAKALPLVALVGSFLVQTHVGMLPVIVALGLLALGMSRRAGSLGADRPRWWRAINVAAWVGVAMWALPLAEQVTTPRGNLQQIAAFFLDRPESLSPGHALNAWAVALAGPLLPGFHIPIGWAVGGEPHPGAWCLALAQVIGLGAVAWRQRRDPGVSASCLALVLAELVALVAILRIPGEVHDHAVFWLGVLGASGWGLLVGAVAVEIRGAQPRLDTVRPRAAGPIALVVLALAIGVAAVPFARPLWATPAGMRENDIAALHAATIREMRARGVSAPLVRIEDAVWSEAAGLLLQMSKGGEAFAVERRWLHMYGAPLGARRCEFAHALHVVHAGSPGRGEPVARAGRVEVRVEASPACTDADLAP